MLHTIETIRLTSCSFKRCGQVWWNGKADRRAFARVETEIVLVGRVTVDSISVHQMGLRYCCSSVQLHECLYSNLVHVR
jgi:hypothetical protein